jgi:aldehyde:ferredoxin oxidoreductase
MTATAKSPLTDAVGDSQCGGFFPAEMKNAGLDAVVITGQAEKPVYLWVQNGEAELRSAEHLWGKTTGEVEKILKEELGDPRIEILQCGPAGERGVRYAAVITMANRAMGRTGMGAVMGSKNLRAVVVRGDQNPALHDRDALMELSRWGAKHFPESDVYDTGVYGTAAVVRWQDSAGGLPTRNWSSGTFEGHMALDGTTMSDTILQKRDTCYSCVVRCKRVVKVETGPYQVDPLYGGPEYETIATLGSYCGVDNLEAVSYANQLCNMYGMDTISCGATIAWAMDCFEQGLLTKEDTDGIDLHFGNAEAMVTLVEKIAHRAGFGALLAEGSARAAEHIGPAAEDLVVAVKKMEYPAHMPQVKRSLALVYAVNPFGADHESSEHDPSYQNYPERMAALGLTDPQPSDVLNKEKVRYALTTMYFYSAMNTLNLCQFVYGPSWQLYGPDQLLETVRAITGWKASMEEILTIGKRRLNLQRAFNAREGIGRSQDRLPKKMTRALEGGKTDGVSINPADLEQAQDWYYHLAGWDPRTGTPTRETLEALELAWVADLLEGAPR